MDEAQCIRWEVEGAEVGKLDWSWELMESKLYREVNTGISKDFKAWQ